MNVSERQSLVEKIEALPPDARERVEGYVDALLEGRRSGPGQRDGQDWSEGESSEEERYLQQDWAGALSDLKDEYTSLELEEEIKKQWMKMTHD
jgi:hypothetical protein